MNYQRLDYQTLNHESRESHEWDHKNLVLVGFQVVAARSEVGSIVITTNRPFREWGALFDVDNTLATALIDRLMHHGEGIVVQAQPSCWVIPAVGSLKSGPVLAPGSDPESASNSAWGASS